MAKSGQNGHFGLIIAKGGGLQCSKWEDRNKIDTTQDIVRGPDAYSGKKIAFAFIQAELLDPLSSKWPFSGIFRHFTLCRPLQVIKWEGHMLQSLPRHMTNRCSHSYLLV